MSSSIKIPSQSRDLNMEPDPQEPSFSYEEKIINQSPLLSIRDEDELYRLTIRTNQRIRNGTSNTSNSSLVSHSNGHLHHNSTNSSGPEFNSSEMKPVERNSVMNFNNDVSGLGSSFNVVSAYYLRFYVIQVRTNHSFIMIFPVYALRTPATRRSTSKRV
jgi:hypothetical protein